ncbi:MAG TPA: DUF4097 family beta strand repeat-containing protein [Bryobacteraceae bacterium]|nr:DUF4097 family beta strand repeat-containing protein [Bryobacteraceae bacterium]
MKLSILSLLLTAPAALFSATSAGPFHWSGHVLAGQQIEVRGINGSIHAQPASGESVDVIAYKNGIAYDPGDVQVKVVERDGGIVICAVYPDASGESECLNGAGNLNNDVSVDFTVSVPRGVRFVARTVNGRVEAQSLQADTEVHTVNGDVVLSTEGAAQGETVNGSIVASLGRIGSPLKFSTVNGGITVEVPSSAGARIHARTINGRIRTDFPLMVRGRFPSKRADGAIGCGGPELRIATVNGNISLRRNKRVSTL